MVVLPPCKLLLYSCSRQMSITYLFSPWFSTGRNCPGKTEFLSWNVLEMSWNFNFKFLWTPCKCTHCTVMPTFIECRCCREFQGLLDGKLENGCITSHKNFDTLCLYKIVLETAFIKYRCYKNIFTDVKEMTAK